MHAICMPVCHDVYHENVYVNCLIVQYACTDERSKGLACDSYKSTI